MTIKVLLDAPNAAEKIFCFTPVFPIECLVCVEVFFILKVYSIQQDLLFSDPFAKLF